MTPLRANSVAASAVQDYRQMIDAWVGVSPAHEERAMVAAHLLEVHANRTPLLTLCDLDGLSSLPPLPDCVVRLMVRNCPSLLSMPGAGISASSARWPAGLKELYIKDCNALTALETDWPLALRCLTISHCLALESVRAAPSPALRSVVISDCPKLHALSEQWPAELREFKLTRCAAWSNLPASLPDSLRELSINNCASFTHLPGPLPSALRGLEITDCPALTALCELNLAFLRRLTIRNCSALVALPRLSTPRLLTLSLVACGALTRLPARLPESLAHLDLIACISLAFVPRYHLGLEVRLPIHLIQDTLDEGERILPAACFDHIPARSAYRHTEICELIDHFSLRTANRRGEWIDSYTPLHGGEPVSIATQNPPFGHDTVERIAMHHAALVMLLVERVPNVIVNLKYQVVVAEQSAEAQVAIARLYDEIVIGDELSSDALEYITCTKKPSPLMETRPLLVEEEGYCRRLSASITELAQQIPNVPWHPNARAKVSIERADGEMVLFDGGYAVHSSCIDRALFSQVLCACKQGDEEMFLAAMADFQAGWPAPGPLDGARLTFQEEFVRLFVTGYFSSEWIKREYYHFILRCGQIH
ncbi:MULTISPECIES: hypothetical protein [unclassified Undibacterium]|uniref:hypothetical protein n=1 Tax=unclassified Undibacterium TaxID=2630295 RepID=UPI002AC8A957|nr:MULTISPECIES: hypothetical protein [unclassified Undibacterium]MEB0138065.1 hypothetical protein [Undibacterium sp. CCC2.1]MEB0171197.1 hypothetical protein [Undibacterium sp. CCC1.1]MEB0175242.1 hypothetical protein [Undibacterium sp. CCC3.4]MEB0214650.1 hypothetical protein [Undibacterium sp. 5I2]WPX42417.1 hypothetical protein RHM61_13560 [Undibacterium sp. CCC3.4]